MDAVIYENIRVKGFEIQEINILEITSEINEHSTVKLTGIIDEKQKDKYIFSTYEGKEIEIYVEDEKRITLFYGVITNIELEVIGGLYSISIEGKSFSYKLDIKKESKSFQNKKDMYSKVIGNTLDKYSGINYGLNFKDEEINELIIQYEETDWEFIKRIISKYNKMILVDCRKSYIDIALGLYKNVRESKLNIEAYKVFKEITSFKWMKGNYIKDAKETDYISYEVKAFEVLNIGDKVKIQNKDFYVYKLKQEIVDSILEGTYYLRVFNGLRSKRLFNKKIVGSSINGKIIETKETTVKIHLNIDKSQSPGEAYWFKFSTMSASSDGSGWYCMPEIGDSVRLYFPTKDEDKAFAVSAISDYTGEDDEDDLMGNPDNKYLKTANDKQVRLTPEGIFISCDSGQADMSILSDGTVNITSTNSISVQAQKNISIETEKTLSISAIQEIFIGSDQNGALQFDSEGQVKEMGVKVNNN